jgi:peptidoglycan-associated lipoprotein
LFYLLFKRVFGIILLFKPIREEKMKLFKLISATAVALFIIGAVNAQKNFTKDADAAFTGEAYFKAIDLYKKAYQSEKSKSKKAEILFRIGECYRLTIDPKQAEIWYDKAIAAKYPDALAILYKADAIKAQGRYDEALTLYKEYNTQQPDDPRGTSGIKSCEMAQKWKDTPTRYEVQNEVLLNSKNYDFSPAFADKKYESLIFTSTREGSTGKEADTRTGESFSDLYYSLRDKKGKWSVPTLLDATVNSEGNEGASCMNRKYSTLYFTRCGYDPKKSLTCNIFTSDKKGQAWGDAIPLTLGPDTITFGHPSLSPDDEYLIFAADLSGGYGGKDLWLSKYDKKGKSWSTPLNLGADVNTALDDMFPYIHDDGTLYFSSNGHPGMGGLDIFKAQKLGPEKWGKVENMGYPINSSANDFGLIVEGDKPRGYFTSNRADGKGGDDIYSFYMPSLVFVIQGNITDVDSKQPIAGATIKLVGSDGTSVEKKSDENGFYIFAEKEGNAADRYINENTTYQIFVSKNEYLNAKGQQTTVGVDKSTTFVEDFALQNISKPEKEIRFPEVLYEFGKYELLPQSKDSLNFLYQTLIDNPTIVIELSAHTDSRGSDKLNDPLSQNRAQACVDYLVSKGIPGDRMLAKGYGKRRLKITDAEIKKMTTEEEREAAHQKNRRTVFSVLRTDYVYKGGQTENQ